MSSRSKLSFFAWVAVLLVAIAWLIWTSATQIERIDFVSQLAGGSQVELEDDSPTGYEDGVRVLIVPGNNHESYQWIAQTQLMLAGGTWRLRHVDYDNAPFGRAVFSASPYRWWLAVVAWIDHVTSGRPLAVSVERAALFADPLFHLLLLIVTAMYVARCFGSFAAASLVVFLTLAFPFAGSFLPGQPDDDVMVLACVLWSVLPLVHGLRQHSRDVSEGAEGPVRVRRDVHQSFLCAGVAGGVGLWVDVSGVAMVLIGIAIGGVAVSLFRRWNSGGRGVGGCSPRCIFTAWRTWALAGAATSIAAYLLEFFPDHIWALRLDGNHPLYAAAWLGAGELLVRTTRWIEGGQPVRKPREVLAGGLALLAVLSPPAAMLMTQSRGFLPDAPRLTDLPGIAAAEGLITWISRDGLDLTVLATLLPVLLLIAPAWLFRRRGSSGVVSRSILMLAWVPVGVALIVAWFEPGWWNHFGATLAVLVVAAAGMETSVRTSAMRWMGLVAVTVVLLPGAAFFLSQARASASRIVTRGEVEGLIEREFSHWLARQAGREGAVVLAPPRLTTSLFFHGGLRGLATPFRENTDGFAAAVRISAATFADEAKALADRRELTHIVIPTWDPFLDEYARLGARDAKDTLIAMLHRLLPPRWLRPVPYQLPNIKGFENDSVAVFRVVEVQDNASALSRLAEYLIEMGQIDSATAVGQALEHSFPGDLSALIARALIAAARRDELAFRLVMDAVLPYLTNGTDDMLPWDRRVSLALALAQHGSHSLARKQVAWCLEEVDEELLRSLSSVSLHRFRELAGAYKLDFPDKGLRDVIRKLLPAEARGGQ